MVHTFQALGVNLAVDVNSGAVHVLDEVTYHLLEKVTPPMGEHCPEEVKASLSQYDPAALEEAWQELRGLAAEGLLFEEDDYIDREKAASMQQSALVKALCLHVSHDCNLRCKYCFASTGDFGTGHRMTMDVETAKKAIDFVVEKSGPRRNIEVDFFGGEPLMAMETVKETVAYARSIEKEKGKCFRFTITTNGVLLNDENIEYINREMSNAVLSIDGRREVNDDLRPTVNGKGSYDVIVPKFRKLIEGRGTDYYLRGTFTRFHQGTSAEDVKALASIGRNISVEPVVGQGEGSLCPPGGRSARPEGGVRAPGGVSQGPPGNQLLPLQCGSGPRPLRDQAPAGLRGGAGWICGHTPGRGYLPLPHFVRQRDVQAGRPYDGTFDMDCPGNLPV